MPCRHGISPQFPGFLPEDTELDMAVAANAGIRGSSVDVLAAEIFDDTFFEDVTQIYYVMRYSQTLSNFPGIVRLINPAASPELFSGNMEPLSTFPAERPSA